MFCKYSKILPRKNYLCIAKNEVMTISSMNRLIISAVILFCIHFAGAVRADAQNVFEETVSFDKIVHDFGDIMLSDGPQECTFKVKNISDRPVVIHRVLTSCGCTEPTWTEAPIRPGDTGEIKVVFSNDQGPYPFSKSVTVYVAGLSKPVILKVRGVVHERQKSLSELFPVSAGPVGFREASVSLGQIEQGLARSVEVEMANTSGRAVEVRFADMTPGLTVSMASATVPARSKVRISCMVDTRRTEGQKWGKTPFTFSVVVDGRKYSKVLTVEALIKENFASLSESQKRAGALPQFESSSIELGVVEAGTVLNGEFTVKNIGKDAFRIYKVDASEGGTTVDVPEPVPFGERGTVRVRVNTKGQSGEMLNILTLITNSPTRPIINLFVIYTVK